MVKSHLVDGKGSSLVVECIWLYGPTGSSSRKSIYKLPTLFSSCKQDEKASFPQNYTFAGGKKGQVEWGYMSAGS